MTDKLIPMKDGEHFLCIIKATPLIVECLKWFGNARNLPPVMCSLAIKDKKLSEDDILSQIEASDMYVVINNCHHNDFAKQYVNPDDVLALGCCGRTQIYLASKKELIEYAKPGDYENEPDIVRMLRKELIEDSLSEIVKHNFRNNCYDFANCVTLSSYSAVTYDYEANRQAQDAEFYACVVSTTAIATLWDKEDGADVPEEKRKAIFITNTKDQPFGSTIFTTLAFYYSPIANTENLTDNE